MPTTESFYAIVFRVFVCICFPCGSGQVVDVLVGARILVLLWGRSGGCWDLMCGDWGGAAGVSGTWEWRLMGRTRLSFLSSTGVMWWCGPLYGCAGFYIEAEKQLTCSRSSAVHSRYCKFLPRFLWV